MDIVHADPVVPAEVAILCVSPWVSSAAGKTDPAGVVAAADEVELSQKVQSRSTPVRCGGPDWSPALSPGQAPNTDRSRPPTRELLPGAFSRVTSEHVPVC